MRNPNKQILDLIQRYWYQSEEYTKILSLICRQTAFAEGGLFWYTQTTLKLSNLSIAIGFLFLLLYFFSDAIQYLLGYIKYKDIGDKYFQDYNVKKIRRMSHYKHPGNLNFWMEKLLYLKIYFLILASLWLITIVAIALFPN